MILGAGRRCGRRGRRSRQSCLFQTRERTLADFQLAFAQGAYYSMFSIFIRVHRSWRLARRLARRP